MCVNGIYFDLYGNKRMDRVGIIRFIDMIYSKQIDLTGSKYVMGFFAFMTAYQNKEAILGI